MSRPHPRPEDFLPLHPFELRILLALTRGPAHGYPIIKAIEESDGSWKRVLPANLYRRLRDLKGRGLVVEVDAPEGAPADDRQRRTRREHRDERQRSAHDHRAFGIRVA